jgi:hypothetical protein
MPCASTIFLGNFLIGQYPSFQGQRCTFPTTLGYEHDELVYVEMHHAATASPL